LAKSPLNNLNGAGMRSGVRIEDVADAGNDFTWFDSSRE